MSRRHRSARLSKQLQNQRDADVDLRDVVPPFSYAGTWHQPTVFVELVINKAFWNALDPKDRTLIEAVARSAVLTSFATRVIMQGEALRFLARQGITQLRWPQGLIDQLRAALPTAMAQESAAHAAAGDTTFGRLYEAMTAFQKGQAVFSDYGDINQGQAGLLTSPRSR